MSAKIPAKGHTAKHVHHRKHTAHRKHHPVHQKKTGGGAAHHVTTVAHHPKQAKPRGFGVGDLLPVCALEAVAMSLRLAGQPVSDDEVAWLWETCGRRELSITEALAAAARFGLAGRRPCLNALPDCEQVNHLMLRRFEVSDACPAVTAAAVGVDEALGLSGFCPRLEEHHGDCSTALRDTRVVTGSDDPDGIWPYLAGDVQFRMPLLPGHVLILGVDWPGPHAVLATPDGWWSWGELWSPWPCRVEEAWAVTWS